MRFRLRTLLIVLAIVPPLVWVGWAKYQAWQTEREQARVRRVWLDQFGVHPPQQELRAASPP